MHAFREIRNSEIWFKLLYNLPLKFIDFDKWAKVFNFSQAMRVVCLNPCLILYLTVLLFTSDFKASLADDDAKMRNIEKSSFSKSIKFVNIWKDGCPSRRRYQRNRVHGNASTKVSCFGYTATKMLASFGLLEFCFVVHSIEWLVLFFLWPDMESKRLW